MRSKVVNIVIFVFMLLVTICFVEISLRAFYPIHFTGNIGAYRYDETLGVRLKKSIHSFRTTDYQQEVLTNEFGSNNFQDSFAGYDKLVFAVGDSYTQGTGLPVDASYPFQLSMMLNTLDDSFIKKYAIINLGLDGYGTKQAILSLPILKGIYGKPDYILYFGCSNDYLDDIMFEKGYRHKFLVDGNPYWGKMLKPVQWLTNETEIGKRIKMAAGNMKKKSYQKSDQFEKKQFREAAKGNTVQLSEKLAPVNNVKEREKSKVIAELQKPQLERLLEASKKMDAQLIVSWAELPQKEPNSYSWMKLWAVNNHVAFADWHPQVKSILKEIPNIPQTNNHSGGHYRTWVNGIIAKSFAEQIQK